MNEGKHLYFQDSAIAIPDIVKFAVSASAFRQMQEAGLSSPLNMFRSVSEMSNLLITSENVIRDGSIRFFLHVNNYVFVFKESESENALDASGVFHKEETDQFVIVAFREKTWRDTNRALMHGKRFSLARGVVFLIRLRSLGEPMALHKGMNLSYSSFRENGGKQAVKAIRKYCEQEQDRSPNRLQEKEELTPELLELLKTAEDYAQLTYEKEQRDIDEKGKIPYSNIESVDISRKDRIAYRFSIPKQKEEMFAVKMMVDVLDSSTDRGYTAEITKIETNDEEELLTLLFTGEVDLRLLSSQGWLRPTASTVVLDVQTAAVDKIRMGTSKAQYFNKVLGKKKPSGFVQENLEELENQLRTKEYPQNDSQIEAIKQGIQSKDIYLVMGPPGTGKTTVILEWVKYFVKEKHWRVLVSSQNNKAVDNVLERLAEEQDIDTIRIGSEEKVKENLVPYIFENKMNSLRESIADATSSSVGEIRETIENWKAYAKRLEAFKPKNAQFLAKRQETERYVDLYIHQTKNLMYQYMNRSQTCIESINQQQRKIADYKIRCEKHANSSGIRKVCLYFPMLIARQGIDKGYEKLAKLAQEQNFCAYNYNECYKKLNLNYQYFDEHILPAYYEVYETFIEDVGYLSEHIPSDPTNLGLYPRRILSVSELYSSDALNEYIALIGQCSARAQSLLQDIETWNQEVSSSQNYGLSQILLDSVDLVGATCIGVSSQKRFQDLDFDVTIIDEAGQIQIHNALVPMSVSNKVIMLGDYMQIPPVADEEVKKSCINVEVRTDLLEKSLFEEMYINLPSSNKTMLDTQYRMPAEIADIISDWFYDGKYKSFKNKRNMDPFFSSISDKNLLLINVHSKEGRPLEKKLEMGYSNPTEAEVVKKTVKRIMEIGDYAERMGVIFPYKGQVTLVKNELKKMDPRLAKNDLVASLDSFQGQEKDIIIYGFTRSSKKLATASRIGFLKELRRVNVAMSRCKKFLVLVGDFDFLVNCEKDDAEIETLSEDKSRVVSGSEKVFSGFMQYMCNRVKAGSGEFIDMDDFLRRIEGD